MIGDVLVVGFILLIYYALLLIDLAKLREFLNMLRIVFASKFKWCVVAKIKMLDFFEKVALKNKLGNIR